MSYEFDGILFFGSASPIQRIKLGVHQTPRNIKINPDLGRNENHNSVSLGSSKVTRESGWVWLPSTDAVKLPFLGQLLLKAYDAT